jgi:hypothetical protein
VNFMVPTVTTKRSFPFPRELAWGCDFVSTPCGACPRGYGSRVQITTIAFAVTIAALSGVSLVANAACSRAPSPAPDLALALPSSECPDLAAVLSTPQECPDLAAVLSAPQECPDLAAVFSPDAIDPPPDPNEPQAFCCTKVGKGPEKKGEGTGCTAISAELVNSCDKVLNCPGVYIKDDGKVECL